MHETGGISRVSLADPGEASAGAIALSGALGISITMADVLVRGGRGDDDETRRFLDPLLSHLTPPDAMADRDRSAERIARAIKARERIVVFGDYDCDGITATAIMTSVIRALGGDVTPLLATRMEGAYGLSEPAMKRVLAARPTLLITCDCGSSDHARLAAARAAGVDAIVIDHHLVPDEPLPAFSFLNPHRPDCGFPFKWLASCGLALSVGAALRKEMNVALDLRPLLDLVAIGTVADVAPLTGDNRALVRAGLRVLASGARPGLRALAAAARVDIEKLGTAEEIAFRIAPRLNAPGRIADPDDALRLLLARDGDEAAGLAASIEQAQIKRREIQDKMLVEAIAEIDASGYATAPAILIAREGFHPGVVGIVAGRIASQYGKPTIVVGLDGAEGRGSVRGPSGFRLHDALTRARGELVSFGGHQAAAGVHVRADRVAALRDAWCEACASQGSDGSQVAAAPADVRLDDRDDFALVADNLAALEPCGEGNRPPLVLIPRAKVVEARSLKGHLKLDLLFARRKIGAFAFNRGALAEGLAGGVVDVAGKLRRDTYRGGDAVEMLFEQVARVDEA